MHLSVSQLQLISQHQPTPRDEQSLLRAAVAIILRDGEHGTECLLMQRAHHDNDPWSGQMSFPGGKIDPQDESAKAAAIRETFEEVGIQLDDQDFVGRLDDLYGLKVDNRYSVHVVPYVFKISAPVELRANYEVADLVWLPLAWLHDPDNAHDYFHPKDTRVQMPAVLINADKEQILWGLSLRMLSMFYQVLGLRLEVLPPQQEESLQQMEKFNMKSDDLDDITRKAINRGTSR